MPEGFLVYPAINPYGDLFEKKSAQRTSNFLILGAFASIGVLVGGAALFQGSAPGDFLMVLFPLAIIFWVVGCCYYAKSKGYSALVGLLGILSVFGLLILLLIPDKWKAALALQEQSAKMPPPNRFGGTAYPR